MQVQHLAGRRPRGRARVIGASLAAALLALTACTNGALDEEEAEITLDDEDDDVAAADDEGETWDWTLQSYSIAGTEAHDYVEDWADRVNRLSEGRINIDVQPGGAIVGYPEMREALTDGVLDIAVNASGFFMGDDPAFAAWYNMPVLPQDDPELARYLARQWVYEWDGLELARELYEPFDIHTIGAVMVMNEPVHSLEPLESIEDFEGKVFRAAPGLTGAMFEAVGAEWQSMPGGEIYTALDTGVIDGAEFVGFTENFGLGLHEVAPYAQYPAFHSQVPIVDVSIRTGIWEELPEHLQLMLEDSVRWLDMKLDHAIQLRDYEMMEVLEAEHGVTITELNEEDKARVRELAFEQAEAWADQSELSARFVESMFEFLEFTGHLDE